MHDANRGANRIEYMGRVIWLEGCYKPFKIDSSIKGVKFSRRLPDSDFPGFLHTNAFEGNAERIIQDVPTKKLHLAS